MNERAMSNKSDQSKYSSEGIGSDDDQNLISVRIKSDKKLATQKLNCKTLKDLILGMRHTYNDNMNFAERNGDVIAKEAYKQQVKILDDLFVKVCTGVKSTETIELPPIPTTYKMSPPHNNPNVEYPRPQQQANNHPFYNPIPFVSPLNPYAYHYYGPLLNSKAFTQSQMPFVPFASYAGSISSESNGPSITEVTEIRKEQQLEGTEPSKNATPSSSEQKQTPTSGKNAGSITQQQNLSKTVYAREITSPTPVATGEPKATASAKVSVAKDCEKKTTKTDQNTIKKQTNPPKTEPELATTNRKEADHTEASKPKSATRKPQSRSKTPQKKQKKEASAKLSSDKKEVKQAESDSKKAKETEDKSGTNEAKVLETKTKLEKKDVERAEQKIPQQKIVAEEAKIEPSDHESVKKSGVNEERRGESKGKSVESEAKPYPSLISVDPKPNKHLMSSNEIIAKLSRFVPNIEKLFRLLTNVDDLLKKEELEWSQQSVEEYLLGRFEFSHISELILWELLLIREEDHSFYLNPMIRKYLNKFKVLNYVNDNVCVEINQLADQTAGLWQDSNKLTKLAELWKILLSEELCNVFVIEEVPNNNGKIETWVRLNRCLDISDLFTRKVHTTVIEREE